jgi:uncharacterized membrane protein
MIAYLVAYGAAAVAFLAGDAVWLTLTGPKLYRPAIGHLLAERVNIAAAVAFYLMYLAGVVILAVSPALRTGQWRSAALHGLVLGLVAYGTYDLTNQATLKLWTTRLTLLDMGWGGVLTTAAATAGFLAARKFGG